MVYTKHKLELNLQEIYKNKVFVTVVFIIGMFSIVAFTFLIPTKPVQNQQLAFETHPQTSTVLGTSDVQDETTEYIYVQISGAIKTPQVAKLKKSTRVFELIDSSGGFTVDASNAYVNKILNLAKVLNDGEKIYIPFAIEELEPDFSTKYSENSTEKSNIININTANKEELKTLPQVGDSTADKIIDYRTKNGSFKSIDEIKNVSGIGEKTFEELKDLISV